MSHPLPLFRVIPVFDLSGGRVVLARGGDRSHYQTVNGTYGKGDDPLGLAARIRDALGLSEIYVADLDAIQGRVGHAALLSRMIDAGFTMTADLGLVDTGKVVPPGVSKVVAATETLSGPDALARLSASLGPDRIVFGLDLKNGCPLLAPGSVWTDLRAEALLGAAVHAGVREVLLLDLGRVGSGKGVGTVGLLRWVKREAPGVAVLVGGGVSGPGDLAVLRDEGAEGVLVASALHDGRLMGRLNLFQ